MWEKRKGFTLPKELLLLSEPASQYRRMNLPKIGDNDRTHKKIQINYLDIWSMLLSGQVPHIIGAIQVTYFGISKILC